MTAGAHNPAAPVQIPTPQVVLTVAKLTYGRVCETPAFLRSIARSGNEFECRGKSLCGDLFVIRDSRRASPLGHRGLFWAKPLASLGVSRRSGYRVLRARFRSQQAVLLRFGPIASSGRGMWRAVQNGGARLSKELRRVATRQETCLRDIIAQA
jgi:hypothetical protein